MKFFYLSLLVCNAILLTSCALNSPATITEEQIPTATKTSHLSLSPTQAPSPTPVPTDTPTPTLTPTYTPTPIPTVVITASVWITHPMVAALTYHQFMPDWAEYSTAVKTRYEDVRLHFQSLYDAGYSLVALEDWINGEIEIPLGRRPLIVTLDDLFFNNQLTLLEDGTPSQETGIGIMWAFGQEHPDFGFHLALFATLGDKLYANPDYPDWQEKLAKAIAWSMDNGAKVYNHTYQHVSLDLTKPNDIVTQLERNDTYLRELLTLIEREDLIPQLGNIIALPYGRWPATPLGMDKLLGYATPEGKPVQAIMEIDYVYRPKFILAPYREAFDILHLPRIVATQGAIDYLIENRDQFPARGECTMTGLDQNQVSDPEYLKIQIEEQLQAGLCTPGVYMIGEQIFDFAVPTEADVSGN
jgi:hypothetical protein